MKSLRRLMVLGMVVLVGCGALQPRSTPPQATEPPLLISVKYSGGLCPSDTGRGSMTCTGTNDILTDGTLTVSANGNLVKTAMLSADELATLTTLVNTTNFTAIRAVPFTGLCPSAYDGSEAFYTFVTTHGMEEVASCTVTIDDMLPLFQTLSTILEKYQ